MKNIIKSRQILENEAIILKSKIENKLGFFQHLQQDLSMKVRSLEKDN